MSSISSGAAIPENARKRFHVRPSVRRRNSRRAPMPPRCAGSPNACARRALGGLRNCDCSSTRSARPAKPESALPAEHIEQPDSCHSNPAARKTASNPSASACRLTAVEPGTTIARTAGRYARAAHVLCRRTQVIEPRIRARADEDALERTSGERVTWCEVHVGERAFERDAPRRIGGPSDRGPHP